MNKSRFVTVLTFFTIFLFCISANSAPPIKTVSAGKPKNGKLIKGQVVAKTFNDELPDSLLAGFNGKVKDKIPGKNTFLIEFPEVVPLEVVIRKLENSPKVDFAESNYKIDIAEVYQISISSPDQLAPALVLRSSPFSYYGQQTNLNIGLDSAQLLSTGQGVVVAVIDNGLDLSHPLFEGRIYPNGFDFIENDADPSEEPGKVYGHGTFVAGLIALVAPDCMILPIRSFNEDGAGSTFSIVKGLNHAIGQHAKIVNMSFGLEVHSQLVDYAVANALANGITLVASSGNDGNGLVMYPAACPGVIAVSAIDTLELIADFSNYGELLDLCAPGVNLYSSLAGPYEWGWWSGTSFSASVVSGVAALLTSRRAGLSPLEIESLFRNKSRIDLNWGSILTPDTYYGYGVVDAYRALLSVGRGDLNNSGSVDVTDLNKYVNYIFRGGELGAWPTQTADFNCDSKINVSDLNVIVNYVFRDGPLFDPCY